MDHRPRFSTLNTSYEDFLFAPVCEDANGMCLSVISALARTNVDPWEEASRLAAMPKAIAEKTLLSILDLVSGGSWNAPEAAAIATRLVRLLPQSGETAPMAAAGTVNAAPGCYSAWGPPHDRRRGPGMVAIQIKRLAGSHASRMGVIFQSVFTAGCPERIRTAECRN